MTQEGLAGELMEGLVEELDSPSWIILVMVCERTWGCTGTLLVEYFQQPLIHCWSMKPTAPSVPSVAVRHQLERGNLRLGLCKYRLFQHFDPLVFMKWLLSAWQNWHKFCFLASVSLSRTQKCSLPSDIFCTEQSRHYERKAEWEYFKRPE